jgi:hypothetical protein
MKTALTQGKALGRFKPTASVTFAQGTWPLPHSPHTEPKHRRPGKTSRLEPNASDWLSADSRHEPMDGTRKSVTNCKKKLRHYNLKSPRTVTSYIHCYFSPLFHSDSHFLAEGNGRPWLGRTLNTHVIVRWNSSFYFNFTCSVKMAAAKGGSRKRHATETRNGNPRNKYERKNAKEMWPTRSSSPPASYFLW